MIVCKFELKGMEKFLDLMICETITFHPTPYSWSTKLVKNS
jgi:hypothetical protein